MSDNALDPTPAQAADGGGGTPGPSTDPEPSHEPGHEPGHESDLRGPGDIRRDLALQVREVRQAGRQAVREAREAARQATRDHLQSVRETMRAAREAEADAARAARSGRARGVGEAGEPDTRTRIQQIALDLFTENGYEATSLREIAERLGYTKAALYYHFKTKDEILDSLVNDRVERISDLIAWAQAQPRTVELRHEFLRRYSDLLHEQGHHGLMRFFERNQSSMAQHKAGSVMRERMTQMLDLLTDPAAPLPVQIRSSLAIFALHSTWFTVRDPEITDDERRVAALEVALDLVQ
jgi:AcrR family transcriptional regulator